MAKIRPWRLTVTKAGRMGSSATTSSVPTLIAPELLLTKDVEGLCARERKGAARLLRVAKPAIKRVRRGNVLDVSSLRIMDRCKKCS